MLAALVQMIRPAPMEGRVGSFADARKMAERIKRLLDGQADGHFVQEKVAEEEVNAYLAVLMQGRGRTFSEEGVRQGQDQFRLRFQPGEVTAVWASEAGPLRVTYEVRGAPSRQGAEWVLLKRSVRAGRLPLPGPVADWAARRLAKTLEPLDREQALLASASAIEIRDGAAILSVGRPP
ncbi:MAG: hypothetical protein N2444_09075 [Methylocystis sp.]|nr:hypothetical protein [Methylocystis sp.]